VIHQPHLLRHVPGEPDPSPNLKRSSGPHKVLRKC
jgi:hypothetical protein